MPNWRRRLADYMRKLAAFLYPAEPPPDELVLVFDNGTVTIQARSGTLYILPGGSIRVGEAGEIPQLVVEKVTIARSRWMSSDAVSTAVHVSETPMRSEMN